MRKAAAHHPLSASAEPFQLLALGYHGTLRPDPAFHTRESIPSQLTALLDSLLASACAQLDQRLPPAHRIFSGEPIPAHELLQNLRQHLQDILTLPLAGYLTATGPPPAFTPAHLTRHFPALAHLLHQQISEFVASTVTFFHRLRSDALRIAQWQGIQALPPIERLTATTSDSHPGGHLVLRIIFRGGICIYYKPRPLTGEWLWQALLQSVTAVDPDLQLAAARVIEGCNPERYGWMESVLPHPSPATHFISPRYWHAAGATLCLAQHVRLTDLHLGNLIATPNGPAVTDAECLGTPDSPTPQSSCSGFEPPSIAQDLSATALLPSHIDPSSPDVSGLFGSSGSAAPIRLPRWTQYPDGHFHLDSVSAVLLHHSNLPSPTSPLAVLPQLLAGYRQAAHALIFARKTLLAPASPWLKTLQNTHAPRIILRDTLTYGLLLSQSLSPSLLLSHHRRRLALQQALLQQTRQALPPAILRAELRSLLLLQIPRLTLLPGSRTLAAGSGHPLAVRFSARTAAQEILRTMEALTLDNLESVRIPTLIATLLQATIPPRQH